MTTSKINKIVRSNLSLKPWILSKNTSEIVNSYIQKFYKQTPKAGIFKTDLVQSSKVAAAKPENKGPIRSLRTRERTRTSSTNVAKATATPATANSTSTSTAAAMTPTAVGAITQPARLKGCAPPNVATHARANEQLLGAVINQTSKRGAIASLAANRKLLKSPNYKIYGSRRYGSSASSSSASILRRYESHRRHRNPTGADLNFLLRSIGTYPVSKLANLGLSNAVFKYVTPVRNQHMAARSTNNPAALEVSSAIQRDLMIIDNKVKDRIALGRTRGIRERADRLRDERPNADPMKGWHHPPSPELFFSRGDEQEVAFAELAEQNRRLRTANKLKQFSYMRPGLWPALMSFENSMTDQQKANLKKQSTTSARTAHSRTAHAATPRHPSLTKLTSLSTGAKSNDAPTLQATKHHHQQQNMPSNADSIKSSSLAASPTAKPSAEVETSEAALESTNTGGPTTTATCLLAAAAMAASQGAHNFGRFNRSAFGQNRKY